MAEADKVCPHDGSALRLIGTEASEQLDIVPAQIKVLRHLRRKYACPCCEQYVVTAQKPKQPIKKSLAAPGLLAHVAKLIQPLINLIHDNMTGQAVLHMDETRVQALNEPGRSA